MARIIGKTEDNRDIYGLDFDIEVKECKQTEDGKRVVSMIGSTPSVDRDGDTIRQQGWDLKSFTKNPVILWGHNHEIPAIGRANKFKKNKEALTFDEIEFPKEGVHRFADMIYALMEAKFIRAGSVGFIPTEMQHRKVEDGEPDIFWCPTDFKKQELLELSVCNVGSNRDALVTHLGTKGFKTTGKVKIGDQEFEMKQLIDAIFTEEKQEKGVIRFKHYPLTEEDTTWNGPKETVAADVDQLKKMSTWFDSEEPEVKASYKLPHHQASDLKTVWNGVRASMAALFGARGGVDVPEGDRKGIHSHLARHYREFDKDVPEFKAYSEAELKEIFPLVPPEAFDEFRRQIDFSFGIKEGTSNSDAKKHCKEKAGTFEAAGKEAKYSLEEFPEDLAALKLGLFSGDDKQFVGNLHFDSINELMECCLQKAGAVLSRANKSKLKGAVEAINAVLAAAEPAAADEEGGNNDKPKSPEEVNLKQVLEKLAEMEATVNKLSKQLPVKEKPAIDEIDLDNIKAPDNNNINLEDMELPQEKDEVDINLLSKALKEIKQNQLADISKVITKEIRKAAGIVD